MLHFGRFSLVVAARPHVRPCNNTRFCEFLLKTGAVFVCIMYAYVQFKFDSEKVHVPIENFKDSIQVERELRLGQRRPEYTCFWSFDEETPASFEKKEGRILDVDKLNSAEILKLKKKFKNGIPGWYNATLLQWDGMLLTICFH